MAVGFGVCALASAGACWGIGAAALLGNIAADGVNNGFDHINWKKHGLDALFLAGGGVYARGAAGSLSRDARAGRKVRKRGGCVV